VDVADNLRLVLEHVLRSRGKNTGPWLLFPELPRETPENLMMLGDFNRYWMEKVLRTTDLPKHFTPHSLRHTFAMTLLGGGGGLDRASILYVSRLLGHAKIQTTVDEYGSSLPVRSPGAVTGLATITTPAGFLEQVGVEVSRDGGQDVLGDVRTSRRSKVRSTDVETPRDPQETSDVVPGGSGNNGGNNLVLA
jgi:hypothetical protein